METEECFVLEWGLNFWKPIAQAESYSKPYFLLFTMRKLLHHLQPKKKDSPEEQPVLIGSTEKISYQNAHNHPFILNRTLRSHLKFSFSLGLQPQGHQDGGKPPSTCIALSRHKGALPDQTPVTLRHLPRCRHLLWMQHLADLSRRAGPRGCCPLKISMKTRCSSED